MLILRSHLLPLQIERIKRPAWQVDDILHCHPSADHKAPDVISGLSMKGCWGDRFIGRLDTAAMRRDWSLWRRVETTSTRAKIAGNSNDCQSHPDKV